MEIWYTVKGNETRTLTGHTNWVETLAILANGTLTSGSAEKTIKIWDTFKGIAIKTITGHTNDVRSLTVLPDGNLADASVDKMIIIWEKKT